MEVMQETQAMELVPVQEFQNIIQAAPAALDLNATKASRARAAGHILLQRIQTEGMSDELDRECNGFLVKVKATVEDMESRRKPLTQMFDKVRSVFTELEKQISPKEKDSIYSLIQNQRNAFATKKAEEQRKREIEAQRQLAINREKADLVASAQSQLTAGFNMKIQDVKRYLFDLLHSSTIDTIAENEAALNAFPETYSHQDFEAIGLKLPSTLLTREEIAPLAVEARKGKYGVFSEEYRKQISEYKAEIAMQFPSQLKELEHLVAILQAEEQERIAAKDNAEKLAQLKKAEDERKAKEEAEKLRLIREEADRLEKEAAARQQAAEGEAEMNKQVAMTESLFEAEMQVAGAEPVNAIESYNIVVKAAPAWLLIISFYFEKEGKTEDVVKLEKRTLLQMKTFCEKWYKNKGEKIESPYLEYSPVYKVTARK